MLYQRFFVIKPKIALKTIIERLEGGFATILLEPQLWMKDCADLSAFGEQEYEAQVKLLFLAFLLQEYSGDPEFPSQLRDAPLSLTTFDAWWTCESFMLDEKADCIQKSLRPEILEKIQATGMPAVDDWIARASIANDLKV